MAIQDLMKLVPAPRTPDEVGTKREFQVIEKKLGISFPSDFREFIFNFGSGTFRDSYVHIYNPFIVDFRAMAENPNSPARWFHESGDVPWPSFPARPGLLEIGGNENGHTILYLTEGDSDDWPILVVPHGFENQFERWKMSFTEFFAKAFSNKLKTAALHINGKAVPAKDRTFTQVGDINPKRREEWKARRAKSKPSLPLAK